MLLASNKIYLNSIINEESDFNEGIQYSNVADSSIYNSIAPLKKYSNTIKYYMWEFKNDDYL